MLNWIRLFVLLIIIYSVLSTCSGPQNRAGRLSPAERTRQLKERLDLSDVQADSIKKILTDAQNDMIELRRNRSDDRRAMRAQMRLIRDEMDERIRDVLFENQIEEYEAMREEQRETFRGRLRNRD